MMIATVDAQPKRLEVVLLLDDPGEFGDRSDGYETFLYVSEVVDALEPALERLGHRSRRLSFAMGVPALIAQLDAQRPDVVFHLGQPVPTDPAGEAHVTAMLDLLGLAHTSESPETLMLARDKARAKALFDHARIPTPAYAVSAHGELPVALPRAPWIAKPTLEDGSVGIAYAPPTRGLAQLAERVCVLHQRFDQPILIETFVGGREFQVGIVGSDLMPIVEIDFSGLPLGVPRMIGYETKWKYDSAAFKGTRRVCPAEVSDAFGERIRQLARHTCETFGVQRCTRLDIRMDDQDGLYVLDVNPNPDLSPVATMHVMADAAGWGFDGMVQRLLDLACTARAYGR
jgi:D-alanine-D-alanine ligase